MSPALNVETIFPLLAHYPWTEEALKKDFKPALDAATARKRAEILVQDMVKLKFPWRIMLQLGPENMVLPCYEIEGSDFGQEGPDVPDVYQAHGIGLNWGSLIRFSKACELGRKFFGEQWPERFKKKLLDPRDHLPFVEELLWLAPWRAVTDVEYEAKPYAWTGSKKSIDWRLKSCDQIINLEVKYRPKDWIRRVDGPEFNIVMDSYYDDVREKFPARNDNERNVVAISSPAPSDRSWQLQTKKLLDEVPEIDAVILWAFHSVSMERPFEIQSKDKAFFDLLFDYGTLEDGFHVSVVRHVWRKSNERRAYRADEAFGLLNKLAEDDRNRSL